MPTLRARKTRTAAIRAVKGSSSRGSERRRDGLFRSRRLAAVRRPSSSPSAWSWRALDRLDEGQCGVRRNVARAAPGFGEGPAQGLEALEASAPGRPGRRAAARRGCARPRRRSGRASGAGRDVGRPFGARGPPSGRPLRAGGHGRPSLRRAGVAHRAASHAADPWASVVLARARLAGPGSGAWEAGAGGGARAGAALRRADGRGRLPPRRCGPRGRGCRRSAGRVRGEEGVGASESIWALEAVRSSACSDTGGFGRANQEDGARGDARGMRRRPRARRRPRRRPPRRRLAVHRAGLAVLSGRRLLAGPRGSAWRHGRNAAPGHGSRVRRTGRTTGKPRDGLREDGGRSTVSVPTLGRRRDN